MFLLCEISISFKIIKFWFYLFIVELLSEVANLELLPESESDLELQTKTEFLTHSNPSKKSKP